MKNSPEQEGTGGAVERSELAPRERNPPVLLFFHSPGRRRLPVVAPFRMVAFLSSAGIQIPLHDSHCVTLGETARRYWDPGSKKLKMIPKPWNLHQLSSHLHLQHLRCRQLTPSESVRFALSTSL
ncbi:uncharacterized protein LOC105697399 isoform X2 [Orussus abietinus]|uniref:uncharacterized protein LOC105697399 isoform X2 n=1 Tax=Orussus abietinus TaxID=222816 RepID=UPI0006260706|nr:uncharacterized protein LOC105697399 isoform X2 [Orussus abietinus]